ncbi:MAG: porphobilinogen synthase [Myxococcales bacterium]|nr:porphobilinogen synthase [Myxococcales bacterium]MDP3503389.1 porphobilinogen synthase [Myxococcales bacterium]
MSESFPATRLRRLRRTPAIRRLFKEVDVGLEHLVQPYFVVNGKGVQRETSPGSGLWQVSGDVLAEEVQQLHRAGVGGVMLFGVPDAKWSKGPLEPALREYLAAIELTRKVVPDAVIMADVCLCSLAETGHCGVVEEHRVVNDATLPVLAEMAVLLAKAGVDFVCPSDMMDGRVGAIRAALDEAKCQDVGIVSYAIKMASALYGPFRAAASSAPSFGDRASYQMPAHNRREALRELALDVDEGADLLLVKPALSNLDLIRDARERTQHPLVAYQVSGEYAMVRAAADKGLLDFERLMTELLVSMRRAGADLIITYDARRRAGR